jgi:hypothetical protein
MTVDNDIISVGRKLQEFFFSLNTYNLLIILLFIGTLSLIFGSIQTSFLNAQSIIIIIVSIFSAYLYFKKKFNNRVNTLKMKNRILKKNSILDDVCQTRKNSKTPLCTKYKGAKRNFYTISNLLLQQYNIKD